MKKFLIYFMIPIAILGCGGGSDSSSSGNSGSSGNGEESDNSQPTVFDNRTWVLTYNDQISLSEAYFGLIYKDIFYGATETKSLIGNVSEVTTTKAMNLDLSGSDGSLNLSLDRISSSLYMGKFDAENQTGTSTMTAYNYVGRDQATLEDEWKTSAGTVFNISDKGDFSAVHDQTGCTLSGSITFIENGIYKLNGNAIACINGELDGAFRGMGMVPVNMSSGGLSAKIFSSVLIFSEDKPSESYSSFYLLTN